MYPSIRYQLETDTSTAVIGATELQTLTGVRGDGMKIGVVDDGVDATNPFFNPGGYEYPLTLLAAAICLALAGGGAFSLKRP